MTLPKAARPQVYAPGTGCQATWTLPRHHDGHGRAELLGGRNGCRVSRKMTALGLGRVKTVLGDAGYGAQD
jgi:hypothetical protein